MDILIPGQRLRHLFSGHFHVLREAGRHVVWQCFQAWDFNPLPLNAHQSLRRKDKKSTGEINEGNNLPMTHVAASCQGNSYPDREGCCYHPLL